MTRVYGYMFLGLIVSALTAAMFAYVPDCREFLYSVGKTGETTLSVSGWIVLLAPLAIVLFTGGLMKQLSAGAMMIVFVFFCALMGASLSSVFLVYTEASIMMCFVTASATFGAMALFGLTTQTDLTSWGSVLLMALFGLIVAMVVNIFFKSAAMDFVISLVAVVVFCALTAYAVKSGKSLTIVMTMRKPPKSRFGAHCRFISTLSICCCIFSVCSDKRNDNCFFSQKGRPYLRSSFFVPG